MDFQSHNFRQLICPNRGNPPGIGHLTLYGRTYQSQPNPTVTFSGWIGGAAVVVVGANLPHSPAHLPPAFAMAEMVPKSVRQIQNNPPTIVLFMPDAFISLYKNPGTFWPQMFDLLAQFVVAKEKRENEAKNSAIGLDNLDANIWH
ncbi:hypothetical protein GPALN_005558 [Globodera pallida]|nr:hypothetical protein GPALN_005558 [Globodera pallida]